MTYKEWQSKFEFDLKSIPVSDETKHVFMAYCLGIVGLAQTQERNRCASIVLENPGMPLMSVAELIRNVRS